MTGPEHYLAAERLAEGRDSTGRCYTDPGWKDEPHSDARLRRRELDLAAAAVHTGLAQAAATAMLAARKTSPSGASYGWGYDSDDIDAWFRAASVQGNREAADADSYPEYRS